MSVQIFISKNTVQRFCYDAVMGSENEAALMISGAMVETGGVVVSGAGLRMPGLGAGHVHKKQSFGLCLSNKTMG